MGYVSEQNYIRCLCLDIWTKQGEISGPINFAMALQHHTLTGSVWTFPTRHSLKVVRHGSIRQGQSSELKSMLYIQAVSCHYCLVIVFLGRRRKNCTGIWNKMTFLWRVYTSDEEASEHIQGSLWHRAGFSKISNSGLAKLEFGWWQWRQEGSQVAGLNAVTKVLLRSLFNFSYIVGTSEDWKFLDYFCGVHLGIYIFFWPYLEGHGIKLSPWSTK